MTDNKGILVEKSVFDIEYDKDSFVIQFHVWIDRCKLSECTLPIDVLLKMYRNQNNLNY